MHAKGLGHERSLEYIFIETSGVADPFQVAQTFSDPELQPSVGTWVGDLEDYRFYHEGEQLKTQCLIKPLALGMPVSFENRPALTVGSTGKDHCIMTEGVYVGMVGQVRRDQNGQLKLLSMQHRIFLRED